MNQPALTHMIALKEEAGFNPFSGTENHLIVLLKAFAERGYKTELIVLLIQGGPLIDARMTELQATGVHVLTVTYRPTLDWGAIREVSSLLRERRDHIIHTHLDYADVTGKLAARLAGCGHVVTTVHNQEKNHKQWNWFLMIQLLRFFTHHYIAITESVRDHMIRQEHLPAHKITVVRYGLPLPDATIDRISARQRLNLPSDAFIVGFVGRLVEQKNVPLLLQAIHRGRDLMPELHGVLIGSGPEEAALRDQMHTLSLSNVHMVGMLPNAADFMSAFDVLALPSRWEGLGLVLLEAMLRRVPVIGSRAGAIPEVLAQGKYGLLFDSDDVNGLLDCIQTLYTDDVQRRNLADHAYAAVQREYSTKAMIEKTLQVYEKVLT